MNVEDVFNVRNQRPLTAEEASVIWDRRAELMHENEELHMLFFLAERLARECALGKRCAVCGRYENPSCGEDC